jgi:hypothetical protein
MKKQKRIKGERVRRETVDANLEGHARRNNLVANMLQDRKTRGDSIGVKRRAIGTAYERDATIAISTAPLSVQDFAR